MVIEAACGLITYFFCTLYMFKIFQIKKEKAAAAAAVFDVLLILQLVIAAPMAPWLCTVSCYPAGVAVPTKGL